MQTENRNGKHYTPDDISHIRRLRQRYMPAVIAEITGRTKGAIDRILSIEKSKGAEFPKLKHGNLKHDKAKAETIRNMVRTGMKYKQIQEVIHVHPGVISRTLAAEARGELKW